MSFTDNDPVQPDEGQGEATPSDSPYQEYLSRIEDEDARAVAEEGFKAFDASATKKFQEHAENRKQWEPYEQLGVHQKDPQELAWALQVAEFAQSDPKAFLEWANGTFAEQAGVQQQEPAQFDEFQDPQQQRLDEALSQIQQMQQQIEQYGSRFDQQDEQQAQQQAAQFIEGQIAELQKKHGDEFDREAVELFLPHFTETAKSQEDLRQAVPRAFEALQGLRNKYEKAALQSRVDDTSSPAEGGGVPDMTREKITSLRGPGSAMEEAKRILAQQNRQ